jgi:hypothetical protein
VVPLSARLGMVAIRCGSHSSVEDINLSVAWSTVHLLQHPTKSRQLAQHIEISNNVSFYLDELLELGIEDLQRLQRVSIDDAPAFISVQAAWAKKFGPQVTESGKLSNRFTR